MQTEITPKTAEIAPLKPIPEQVDSFMAAAAEALAMRTSSAAFRTLIETGRGLASEHADARATEQEKVDDPLTGRADLAQARAAVQDLTDDAARVAAVLDRLSQAHGEAEAAEKEDERRRRYDEAKSDRDRLAKEIRESAPALIGSLRTLIEAIQASNEQVDAANRNLPQGAKPLNRAEGQARGFTDNSYESPAGIETFRLTQAMLPDLESRDGVAWPPADFIMGLLRPGRLLSGGQVRQAWLNRSR